ncbi:MAG: thermonuclease family protein [Clostridium sp.]|nr:thermonuclease family protein [Clostridium sp.]
MFLFVFFSLLQQPTFSYNHIGINQNYIVHPQIVSVVDGDTIKIRLKEKDTGVRLTGIDCYETSVNKHIKYQRNKGLSDEQIIEKGLMAKQELIKILQSHKNIYLEITGVDHYSRLVGIFYYKDNNGNYISINNEMMNTGYCPEYIYKRK